MSKEQDQADKLIEQHYKTMPRIGVFSSNYQVAIENALIDTQNTIDAFSTQMPINNKTVFDYVTIRLEHHKAVQTILKSKLK